MAKFKVNYMDYGEPTSWLLESDNEDDAWDEMDSMTFEGCFGVRDESDPWLEEISDSEYEKIKEEDGGVNY